jgi:peptidoglycan hydrolase-like protein with peptidoglycan-binding domain
MSDLLQNKLNDLFSILKKEGFQKEALEVAALYSKAQYQDSERPPADPDAEGEDKKEEWGIPTDNNADSEDIHASVDKLEEEEEGEGEEEFDSGIPRSVQRKNRKNRRSNKSSKKKDKSSGNSLVLRRGSKNRKRVRRLQSALLDAGFKLPRYGADGLYGSETKKAVIAFKEKAKSNGDYSGAINENVSEKTLSLIESYSKASPDKTSTSTPNGWTLLVGDSQMVGHLGQQIKAAVGSGKVLAKGATTAGYWAKHPRLIDQLHKKPSQIIISLNGNGDSGTEALIKAILHHAPSGTKVLWTGAPPPIKRTNSSYTYLNGSSSFLKAYQRRQDINKKVGGLVTAQGWTFLDPYEFIKLDSPQYYAHRRVDSGYNCQSCDGIHLPKDVAKEYASVIKSKLS